MINRKGNTRIEWYDVDILLWGSIVPPATQDRTKKPWLWDIWGDGPRGQKQQPFMDIGASGLYVRKFWVTRLHVQEEYTSGLVSGLHGGFLNQVSGLYPISGFHLATKAYVDDIFGGPGNRLGLSGLSDVSGLWTSGTLVSFNGIYFVPVPPGTVSGNFLTQAVADTLYQQSGNYVTFASGDIRYALSGTTGSSFSEGSGLFNDGLGITHVGQGYGIIVSNSGIRLDTVTLDIRWQVSGTSYTKIESDSRYATSGFHYGVTSGLFVDTLNQQYGINYRAPHTYIPSGNFASILISGLEGQSSDLQTWQPADFFPTHIDASGNVGINDPSPTANLSIRAKAASNNFNTNYVGLYNYTLGALSYEIGFATSIGGNVWTRITEPAIAVGTGWEAFSVKDPCVIHISGTLYCYYAGQAAGPGVWGIGLATSIDDGVTWVKYVSNPVLSGSQAWENNVSFDVFDPVVLYDGSESDSSRRWKMWYAGGQFGIAGIGYAYSADGLAWTKISGNPIITKGADGTWDDSYIIPGAILKQGSIYTLFYNGQDGTTWRGGYVTFTDPEGTYTKFAGNPILQGDGLSSAISSTVTIGAFFIPTISGLIFSSGTAVYIYDNDSHYVSHIVAVSNSGVYLKDAAQSNITSPNGVIKSVSFHSMTIENVDINNNRYRFSDTAFVPGGGDLDNGTKELNIIGFSDDLTAITFNYSFGLMVPVTVTESVADNVSWENLSYCSLDAAPAAQPVEHWKNPNGSVDSIIDESLNWGLGTITPIEKLDVVGNIRSSNRVSGVIGVFGTVTLRGQDTDARYALSGQVPPNERTIIAGSGLIGGGNLSADRVIDVTVGYGLTVSDSGLQVNTAELDVRYALSGSVSAGGGGGSGSNGHFHAQFTATSTYQVDHNLSFYPQVTVLDSGLNEIEVGVIELSTSGLRLDFLGTITSGWVICDTTSGVGGFTEGSGLYNAGNIIHVGNGFGVAVSDSGVQANLTELNTIYALSGSSGGGSSPTLTINASGEITTRTLLERRVIGAGSTIYNSILIPPTYQHLEIKLTARSSGGTTGGDTGFLQFNADTTDANYSNERLAAAGASAVANNAQTARAYVTVGNGAPSGYFSQHIITIPDYATANVGQRTALSLGGESIDTSSDLMDCFFLHWLSTAAISGLRMTTATGFAVGTVIEVYGIRSQWAITSGTFGDLKIRDGIIIP